MGGTNLPQEGIVHFGFRCDPHGFTQSHAHYGTPFLRPSAYKARVRGVSPRYGIEQIREGGIAFSTHSQSE